MLIWKMCANVRTGRPGALLTCSALANLLAALGCLFAGDEVLAASGAAKTGLERVLVQLLGAGLFGFAMLNWMNRYAPVGGIYGRPLVVANLAHTMTAALTLVQIVTRGAQSVVALAALAFFGTFAVAFGVVLFAGPGTRAIGGE